MGNFHFHVSKYWNNLNKHVADCSLIASVIKFSNFKSLNANFMDWKCFHFNYSDHRPATNANFRFWVKLTGLLLEIIGTIEISKVVWKVKLWVWDKSSWYLGKVMVTDISEFNSPPGNTRHSIEKGLNLWFRFEILGNESKTEVLERTPPGGEFMPYTKIINSF